MPAAIPERLLPLNQGSANPDPTSSHNKMVRGLRDQTNAPLYPHLKRGDALPAEAELATLTKSAGELFKSIRTTRDVWAQKLATHRQGKVEQLEAMLSGLLDEGANTSPGARGEANQHIAQVRQLGLQKIDADLAPIRHLIAETDKPSIDERMKRLTVAKEKLARWREAYPSPLAILETFEIDNPRRAALIANVAHMGRLALESAMQTAIATNDKLFAAAIAVRVGQLPEKDRPFNAMQIGQAMFGDVYAKYTDAARAIDLYLDGSTQELTSYFAGKPSTDGNLERIKRGLAELEAAGPTPLPLPKATEDVDPTAAMEHHLDAVAPGLKGTGRLIAAGTYRGDMTPAEVAAAVAALDAAEKQTT